VSVRKRRHQWWRHFVVGSNTALSGGRGGALYVEDGALLVQSTLFYNCSAPSGGAGAVLVVDVPVDTPSSGIQFSNSSILNCYAAAADAYSYGGAVYIWYDKLAANVLQNFSNVAITENQVILSGPPGHGGYGSGAGLLHSNPRRCHGVQCVIAGSNFSCNQAAVQSGYTHGGGAYIAYFSSARNASHIVDGSHLNHNELEADQGNVIGGGCLLGATAMQQASPTGYHAHNFATIRFRRQRRGPKVEASS
jgi:acetyltransferase-like isoleucine patch superfamily enzyme